jgi:hypothetical protein
MGRVPWFILAVVGGFAGLLIGAAMYGDRSVFDHIDPTCYPPEELKIDIVTAVGLLTGLLVHLYWPSRECWATRASR